MVENTVVIHNHGEQEYTTKALVRELLKNFNIKKSSLSQEHCDVTVHITDNQEMIGHNVEERTGIEDL